MVGTMAKLVPNGESPPLVIQPLFYWDVQDGLRWLDLGKMLVNCHGLLLCNGESVKRRVKSSFT